MATISPPRITFNILGAPQAVENAEQRVVLIGQKTASGSAISGSLTTEIGNDGQENALFGENSFLSDMIRNFKAVDFKGIVRLDAIALDDNAGGVQATGSVTFAGAAATEAGTFTVLIGSKRSHSFEIPVAVGDTPTDIGASLVAAITADTKVSVTAANIAGAVTMTAVHKGAFGNSISLRSQGEVAGITVAIAAMAAGSLDPVLTNIFDILGDTRYQTIVWPANYDKSVIKIYLDNRFNINNNVLDGVGVMSETGTLAALKAIGSPLNSRSLMLLGNQLVAEDLYKGSSVFELDTNIASQFAAIRALRLTDGANIAQFIISGNGSRDTFGGAHIASLPYHNTPFQLLPVIDQDKGFTEEEALELIDDAGVSMLGSNTVRSSIIANTIVTTYRTNAAAVPDITFKFLNYVDTPSAIREYFFNNFKSQYAQTRLTAGDVIQGHNMTNEAGIRGFSIKLYSDLAGPGFVLTEAGEEALQFFKQNMVVNLDLANGLADVSYIVRTVTQLREVRGTFTITFAQNQ